MARISVRELKEERVGEVKLWSMDQHRVRIGAQKLFAGWTSEWKVDNHCLEGLQCKDAEVRVALGREEPPPNKPVSKKVEGAGS